jgi:nucleotide-binding universal stress UspA family protein
MPGTRSSGLRIVVGVSYSERGIAALRWAIQQARLMDGAVEAIHAFTVPPLTPYSHTHRFAGELMREQLAESARLALEARIAALRSDVQITAVVREGRPADVLAHASRGAEMLVLGSTGIGILGGLFAGATSYVLVRRAPCPLVLVPSVPPPSRPRLAPVRRASGAITRRGRWVRPGKPAVVGT